MDQPLDGLTHLDAIAIMAQAHLELRHDPRASLREVAEAKRVLLKAEAYQLSLTQRNFDFTSCFDGD
jgi:hypothetical protein